MRISDWSSDVCSSDLLAAYTFMLQLTGQCTTHQHPRTIADPVTYPLDAGGLATEQHQHLVHRCGQVRYRIHQGAVQIEHHQLRQLAVEQLLQTGHGRASASPARIWSDRKSVGSGKGG